MLDFNRHGRARTAIGRRWNGRNHQMRMQFVPSRGNVRNVAVIDRTAAFARYSVPGIHRVVCATRLAIASGGWAHADFDVNPKRMPLEISGDALIRSLVRWPRC